MNFYISALVVSNQDCNWEYLGKFGLFLLYCMEPKFKLRCAGMVGWQLLQNKGIYRCSFYEEDS